MILNVTTKKASDSGKDSDPGKDSDSAKDMQIFVRDISGKTGILDVSPHTTIQEVKVKILDMRMECNQGIFNTEQDIRILFEGKEIESHETLSEKGISACGVLQAVARLRGGMPKKGIKKIPKDEKVFTLRTRVEYITRDPTPDAMHIVRGITLQDTFIQNTIANMTPVDDTQALYETLQTVSRNEKIAELITPYLTPQIRIMRQDIEAQEKAIEQVEATIEHAYAKEFYGTPGYTMNDLYDQAEGRLNTLLENQRVQSGVEAVLASSSHAPMND